MLAMQIALIKSLYKVWIMLKETQNNNNAGDNAPHVYYTLLVFDLDR